MPFPDGYFINAYCLGAWGPRASKLFGHVLLLQRLDRMPAQLHLFGDVLNGHLPAPSSHEKGEALCIERIVRKPGKLLSLHLATPPTLDTPDLHIQVDTHLAAGHVPDTPHLAVVETPVDRPATSARRFF